MTSKRHKAPGWFEALCLRYGVAYAKDENRKVVRFGRRGRFTSEITASEFETIKRCALRRRIERAA